MNLSYYRKTWVEMNYQRIEIPDLLKVCHSFIFYFEIRKVIPRIHYIIIMIINGNSIQCKEGPYSYWIVKYLLGCSWGKGHSVGGMLQF